ncbi:MAG: hypothetical protein U1E52_01880 [Geminicoccaceae bacterium]
MLSKFENILKHNAQNTEDPWRPFASLRPPIYDDVYSNWGSVSYGYKAVADIAAADQINSGRHRPDLFPAIFFLYRHYIELELKAIWINLAGRGLLAMMPCKKHSIAEMWRVILSAAVGANLIRNDDAFVAKIRKSILLIEKIDAKSTNSRYPCSEISNLKDYHAISIRLIDLVCAADDFESFSHALYEIVKLRYEVEP